jgi:hypothetical protein
VERGIMSEPGKVVALTPVEAAPNAAVVAILEELLLLARRGEVTGVAIVASMTGRRTYEGWVRGTTPTMALIGGLDVLKARLIAECLKVEE